SSRPTFLVTRLRATASVASSSDVENVDPESDRADGNFVPVAQRRRLADPFAVDKRAVGRFEVFKEQVRALPSQATVVTGDEDVLQAPLDTSRAADDIREPVDQGLHESILQIRTVKKHLHNSPPLARDQPALPGEHSCLWNTICQRHPEMVTRSRLFVGRPSRGQDGPPAPLAKQSPTPDLRDGSKLICSGVPHACGAREGNVKPLSRG